MSISAFNHPVLSGLFGNDTISAFFDIEAELAAMLKFESALAQAEAACGLISEQTALEITEGCQKFNPDIEALKVSTAQDGVVVPGLIRQLRSTLTGTAKEKLHFGATSQDVIDTAMVLRLQKILPLLRGSLQKIVARLEALDKSFGAKVLMARTRMQHAYETTVSHRLAEWRGPLQKALAKLDTLEADLLNVQFGGAIGTLDKLEERGAEVRSKLAALLGLGDPLGCWHTDRSSIQDLGSWLADVTTSLGKLGTDIALMSMNEVAEIKTRGAGGSSAMPHKQNPVKSEVLITLARFNATNISGLYQSAVHEFERSGSGWSLEWLMLPQMIMTTSGAMRVAGDLLEDVVEIGK